MIETWRWFGPDDPVTLRHVRQAGASGVVTALHEIPTGEVWSLDAIRRRKQLIEDAGLQWTVIESIPVHTDIKTGKGSCRQYTENYKLSLKNVGEAGLKTVCYNFMAVIDWTRTNLAMEMPNSSQALGFDMAEMAAYDIYQLQRHGADQDYSDDVLLRAERHFAAMSDEDKAVLEANILAGLPGGEGSYDRAGFRRALAEFSDLDDEGLRSNFFEFLRAVLPVAEEADVRLSIHPDDPPFRLFGLPRIMSTADDARAMLTALPTDNNGLTLCAGSFGARSDNDLVRMAREFGPRIYFVHLRNVRRSADGSFFESDHLDGDNDMLGLVSELLDEENRRRTAQDGKPPIPMRPDHGHLLGDEMDDENSRPGYSFGGRMKGLAELRGVIYAVEEMRARHPDMYRQGRAGE